MCIFADKCVVALSSDSAAGAKHLTMQQKCGVSCTSLVLTHKSTPFSTRT